MLQERNATLQWGVLAIVVLAGAWTIFHLIWNVAALTSDDYGEGSITDPLSPRTDCRFHAIFSRRFW
jgi:hypothetical protein